MLVAIPEGTTFHSVNRGNTTIDFTKAVSRGMEATTVMANERVTF
jgi:hypothetical protein